MRPALSAELGRCISACRAADERLLCEGVIHHLSDFEVDDGARPWIWQRRMSAVRITRMVLGLALHCLTNFLSRSPANCFFPAYFRAPSASPKWSRQEFFRRYASDEHVADQFLPDFFAQCRWLPALGCAKTRGCATALSSGLFSSKPRLNIEARGGPDARDLRLNKNNWDPRKIGKLDSRFIDPLKEPLSFL